MLPLLIPFLASRGLIDKGLPTAENGKDAGHASVSLTRMCAPTADSHRRRAAVQAFMRVSDP
jgi:hypothetical protein